AERTAGSFSVPQIGHAEHMAAWHEDIVGHDGIAAGGLHAGHTPGITNLVRAGRNEKEQPFGHVPHWGQTADHDPRAVVDATCERRVLTRDAIASINGRDLRRRRDRCRDGNVRTIRPYGFLSFLRELPDHVRMVDQETRAPAM